MTATTRTVHYFSLELTDVAVIVCGRHGLAITVYLLAVTGKFCGCHCLWPSLIWPSWFVAVMVLTLDLSSSRIQMWIHWATR